MADDLLGVRLSAENRRKLAAQSLHYALKIFGHLEFSEIYSIDLHHLPPQRTVDRYEIGPATDADIDYICSVLIRDEPPFVIRRLWSEGHHCFVAREQRRVVAYDWIAFSPVQEEEFRVELRPDHAFCLNAYTEPQHRGRGIHYCLLRTQLEFAANSGKTKAYTLVSLFNKASWKSHIRMGWSREFTYSYFRPYFIPGWLPWAITPPRYPVRLDWQRHSWFARPSAQTSLRA